MLIILFSLQYRADPVGTTVDTMQDPAPAESPVVTMATAAVTTTVCLQTKHNSAKICHKINESGFRVMSMKALTV